MTDHRVTDITYGHLGKATYDLDAQNWGFQRQTSTESSIQPLHSPNECVPPSFSRPPTSSVDLSTTQYTHARWVANVLPETGPASAILPFFRRDEMRNNKNLEPATLLAIGMASDVEHGSGSRKIQIIAMAYGEAGNVLRLIKPRVEILGWHGRQSTKLRSLNAISPENGYWVGDGGPIRAITFAADTNGLTSWLAVQKSECTTILRPIYHQMNAPSTSTMKMGKKYPPSCLNANPILTMKLEMTGGRPHADVSFNPWYVRQFAIVDQQGYWSVWDIEGQKQKRVTFKAVPGKSGHISDNLSSDLRIKPLNKTDGWGRILWAGGLRVLVVCDRHGLVIFDINATPKRLDSPVLVNPDSDEWILDVKRDPNNLHHIFVLTTRQVFLLQVTAAGEDHDDLSTHAGARTILSVRHFRNDDDETAQLALLGEKDVCVVLLYSTRTYIVNIYRFGILAEESTTPSVSQGSFEITPAAKGQYCTRETFQTICLLPTSFMLHNLAPMSGLAREYACRNIRFYQLFGVDKELRLSHVLCATKRLAERKSHSETLFYEKIVAPTARGTQSSKFKSSARIIEDSFIVPDGLEESGDEFDAFNMTKLARSKSSDRNETLNNLSLTFTARSLYKAAYLTDEKSPPYASCTMIEYTKNFQTGFRILKDVGPEGLMTFSDLTGYTYFSEDVDEATAILQELSALSEQEDESERSMAIRVYRMSPSPFTMVTNSYNTTETKPDLSDVYDKIVDLWVSRLSQETPGPIRLAKERTIRNIAMELHLSSIALLVRDKSVLVPKPAVLQSGIDFILPVRGKPASPGYMDSQGAEGSSFPPSSSLPISVPYLAPALNETSKLPKLAEDLAISRLRGYALSIKSEPPLEAAKSAILAQWPSSPGADPFKYSWEAVRATISDDEGSDSYEEEAIKRRKEEVRRNRRIERILNRQRDDTLVATSQPAAAVPFGSQPTLKQLPFSSQSENIPMTQPNRGAFGSRLGIKGFKKRRVRGF